MDPLPPPRPRWSELRERLGAWVGAGGDEEAPGSVGDALARGAWLLAACMAALGVVVLAAGGGGSVVALVVVTAGVYALVPAVVHAGVSRRAVGWLVLALFTSELVFVGLHRDGGMVVASPWWAVVTVFAMYFGGAWLGIGALVATVAGNLVVMWAHATGRVLPLEVGIDPRSGVFAFGQLAGVVATGLLGLMFHDAQDRVIAARDRATERLSESQGRLEALVNNTSDLICSVTRGLRISARNDAFDRFFGDEYAGGIDRGAAILPLLPEEHRGAWRQRLYAALYGERATFTEQHVVDGHLHHVEFRLNPIRVDGEVVGVAVFGRDLTDRVLAEERLQQANRQLVDLSRRAGMAEVATGILHNVGNVLNSVNVSATALRARVGELRVDPLRRLLPLIDEPRGDRERLRAYLASLAEHLSGEKSQLLDEIGSLNRNVEHLTAILQAQRRFAGAPGLVETTPVDRLVDESLELVATTLGSVGVTVVRELGDVPPLRTDRHKVIDILVNLLANAADALRGCDAREVRVVVGASGEGRVRITVTDTGEGISAENLGHLFELGFSTREAGQGIGLHTSAIAARQLGGRLLASSEGPGCGASFTLELPIAS